MITAKLDRLGSGWHGTQFFAGAFNGNRFFTDNNRNLNYDLRLRKMFDGLPLALGASVQLGRQLLPDGTTGNNREYLYGADVQWAWKRFGSRAEFIESVGDRLQVSVSNPVIALIRCETFSYEYVS